MSAAYTLVAKPGPVRAVAVRVWCPDCPVPGQGCPACAHQGTVVVVPAADRAVIEPGDLVVSLSGDGFIACGELAEVA